MELYTHAFEYVPFACKPSGIGTVGRCLSRECVSINSYAVGIPIEKVSSDESEKLIKMEETLHTRVIGQEEAVVAISRAIRRARVGMYSVFVIYVCANTVLLGYMFICSMTCFVTAVWTCATTPKDCLDLQLLPALLGLSAHCVVDVCGSRSFAQHEDACCRCCLFLPVLVKTNADS